MEREQRVESRLSGYREGPVLAVNIRYFSEETFVHSGGSTGRWALVTQGVS